MRYPCDIRAILFDVIRECEAANRRIFLSSPCSPSSSLTPVAPIVPPSPIPGSKGSSYKTTTVMVNWRKCSKRWRRSALRVWQKVRTLHFLPHTRHDTTKRLEDIWSLEEEGPLKQRGSPIENTILNCFDTGFIPPEGKLREEWTHYVQLAHCARWALDNVFGNMEKEQ